MKVVTTQQMRELEQAAVDAGATWSGLMEHAGWSVAQEASQLLGAAHGKQVLVLVGPGNNGGDGLVTARHLHDAGAHVRLYVWRRPENDSDLNRKRCRERDISEEDAANDPDRRELQHGLDQANLVIDALLGMGVSRPVTGELAEIVETINRVKELRTKNKEPKATQPVLSSQFLVLAIDLPTGIHSDTGALLSSAIQADVTVATGQVKRGLLFYPGHHYAGAIRLADIGLTHAQLEAIMSETIDTQHARTLLPARPDDSHKGTYGKVMVVAGSLLYPGAAGLATAGAARVGAGLVTLAAARSIAGGAGRLPEVTLRPLPEVGWGTLGADAADELLKHIEGYKALLVGPGLGREKETHAFLERLLGIEAPRQRGQIGFRVGSGEEKHAPQQRPELPATVIDADGLNILSEIESWWERLPRGRCILTPHPGEMGRLLKVEELDADRTKITEEAAKRWGQVVVLKGATTVVADLEGRSAILTVGNAALATAGTGDVLAGAIAGLLAQGLTPFDAAVAGVYLHHAAGQLVREDMGDAGTIASDLLPKLPLAIKALKA
jgi:NAD(P)H-hydrate epimerase